MLAQQFQEFDLDRLGPWTAPLIGVAAAGLVFLIGWLLVGRRKRAQPIKPQYRTVPASPPPNPVEDDLFIRGSAMERRSSIRRRGNAVAILISDSEASTDPTPGWVVDRSLGGMCLSVDKLVEAGTVLSVRTTNAPPEIPWVKLEVRSCRDVGNEYEIGCQFVRTPPWSVLLLFG